MSLFFTNLMLIYILASLIGMPRIARAILTVIAIICTLIDSAQKRRD